MKRLPFFTKSQRRALLVVEWVLILGVIGLAVWKTTRPQTSSDSQLKGEKTGKSSLLLMKGKWGGYFAEEKERPVETFPFDPNTADSTALLRLGLSPWQVRSIYRYRAKHGRYHEPEDFMRVPNMTVEQWERLKDFIRISPKFRYVQPKPRRALPPRVEVPTDQTLAVADTPKHDLYPRQEKIRPGQTIDINTADTTLLKMIPGIASKRAARIVSYRQALGGFVNVEQAMEAIELPDTVLKYMTVSALPVRKININRLSVQQMMKHPYLNFYQAKAIFEYRRNKGELHSVEELSRLEAFRTTDLDRLSHYVTFD